MTTTAHEWREEVDSWKFDFSSDGGYFQVGENEYVPFPQEYIKAFIQTLLDTHTARLVERIENMEIVDDYGEERKTGFQIAKDQAIDIVKDNLLTTDKQQEN